MFNIVHKRKTTAVNINFPNLKQIVLISHASSVGLEVAVSTILLDTEIYQKLYYNEDLYRYPWSAEDVCKLLW